VGRLAGRSLAWRGHSSRRLNATPVSAGSSRKTSCTTTSTLFTLLLWGRSLLRNALRIESRASWLRVVAFPTSVERCGSGPIEFLVAEGSDCRRGDVATRCHVLPAGTWSPIAIDRSAYRAIGRTSYEFCAGVVGGRWLARTPHSPHGNRRESDRVCHRSHRIPWH
jgi:hypothetical protein